MNSLLSLMFVAGGTVDPAQLKAAVKEKHEDINKCFEAEAVKDNKLQGEVHVGFELQESGKATKVAVKKTTLKNKAVEDCLVKVVAGVSFPKAKGGMVPVVYPFVFEPILVKDVPVPAKPKVPGSFPGAVVRDTVSAKGEQFNGCFQDEKRAKKGDLEGGKIDTEFMVEQDGTVSDAKVTATSIKSDVVTACILATIKSLKFPKPDGETGVRINFPFQFK